MFFCSFISSDRSDKILTCLKTCLWNLGTYRHEIVRLSSAQFGLVTSLVLYFAKSIFSCPTLNFFGGAFGSFLRFAEQNLRRTQKFNLVKISFILELDLVFKHDKLIYSDI